MVGGSWKNKQSISQPSFLKTEIVDGKISFKFSVDIDPFILYEQKTKIEEDFVGNLGKEIKTNIRNGDRKKEELQPHFIGRIPLPSIR